MPKKRFSYKKKTLNKNKKSLSKKKYKKKSKITKTNRNKRNKKVNKKIKGGTVIYTHRQNKIDQIDTYTGIAGLYAIPSNLAEKMKSQLKINEGNKTLNTQNTLMEQSNTPIHGKEISAINITDNNCMASKLILEGNQNSKKLKRIYHTSISCPYCKVEITTERKKPKTNEGKFKISKGKIGIAEHIINCSENKNKLQILSFVVENPDNVLLTEKNIPYSIPTDGSIPAEIINLDGKKILFPEQNINYLIPTDESIPARIVNFDETTNEGTKKKILFQKAIVKQETQSKSIEPIYSNFHSFLELESNNLQIQSPANIKDRTKNFLTITSPYANSTFQGSFSQHGGTGTFQFNLTNMKQILDEIYNPFPNGTEEDILEQINKLLQLLKKNLSNPESRIEGK
jgi:hypothetical protein